MAEPALTCSLAGSWHSRLVAQVLGDCLAEKLPYGNGVSSVRGVASG